LRECIDNVLKDRTSGVGGGGGGGNGPGSSSLEHITKKYDIKSIPAIILNVDFFTRKDCYQYSGTYLPEGICTTCPFKGFNDRI
jgi:hypothetical protein